MPHTVNLPNGEFLTRHSWCKENPLFTNLPFATNLVEADENMGDALGPVLALAKVNFQMTSALIVGALFIWTKSLQHMASSLDQHHPFNNTPAVDLILQNAELMLAPGTLQIGWGHANTVWALMSNFITLDCLSATFGAATAAPGQPVAWRHCEETIAIGTTTEVSLSVSICPIISHLNISSCMSSPHLQKYSANSASLGLLIKRLRTNLESKLTLSISHVILLQLHWPSPGALFPEESRKLW